MSLESNLELIKFADKIKNADSPDQRIRMCIDFIGKNVTEIKEDTKARLTKLHEFVVPEYLESRLTKYDSDRIHENLQYIKNNAKQLNEDHIKAFGQTYEALVHEADRTGDVVVTTNFKEYGKDPIGKTYAESQARENFIKESMRRGNLKVTIDRDEYRGVVKYRYSYHIGSKYPSSKVELDADSQDN